MNTKVKIYLLLLALLSLPGFAHAQGTAISYQGRLNDGSAPATGLYDFTFAVYEEELGGVTETVLAGPLVWVAVPVTNGLFNVTLDFGPNIFTGPARWLQISVRADGVGDFTPLTPRTPLLPTPYSIFAARAAVLANNPLISNPLWPYLENLKVEGKAAPVLRSVRRYSPGNGCPACFAASVSYQTCPPETARH